MDADRQIFIIIIELKVTFRECEHTISKANANGVRLIDMSRYLRMIIKITRLNLTPTDGHWNERAHKLVAEALMRN